MPVQPQRGVGVSLQGGDDGRGVNQGEAEAEIPEDGGKHGQVEPLVVEASEGDRARRMCWTPPRHPMGSLSHPFLWLFPRAAQPCPLPRLPASHRGVFLGKGPGWWGFSELRSSRFCRAVSAHRARAVWPPGWVRAGPSSVGATDAFQVAGWLSAKKQTEKSRSSQQNNRGFSQGPPPDSRTPCPTSVRHPKALPGRHTQHREPWAR